MAREGSADLFFCLVGLQDLVLAQCNTLRSGDSLHCITTCDTAIYHPMGFPVEQRYSSCKYPLENKIFSLNTLWHSVIQSVKVRYNSGIHSAKRTRRRCFCSARIWKNRVGDGLNGIFLVTLRLNGKTKNHHDRERENVVGRTV